MQECADNQADLPPRDQLSSPLTHQFNVIERIIRGNHFSEKGPAKILRLH
jgi:hypothetical protein